MIRSKNILLIRMGVTQAKTGPTKSIAKSGPKILQKLQPHPITLERNRSRDRLGERKSLKSFPRRRSKGKKKEKKIWFGLPKDIGDPEWREKTKNSFYTLTSIIARVPAGLR